MKFGILEIVGLFAIVCGVAGLVGAASLVSAALAVALASACVVLAGVLCVYVATQLEAKAAAEAAKAGPRA
jgi:hypothetical protein